MPEIVISSFQPVRFVILNFGGKDGMHFDMYKDVIMILMHQINSFKSAELL